MKSLPYAFTGPYSQCLVNPDVSMDPRHVFMVYEVLSNWQFRNALELGSFWGASSTAFVEAINRQVERREEPMRATFCDVELKKSLLDVVANCATPDRVRVTDKHSWEVLDLAEEFDFVLVDANHDIRSVQPELGRLLRRKPLCVMAHDTNASKAGYVCAEGAEMLKRAFQALPEYYCTEDCEQRAGEQTHRGLFLATTDDGLFRVAHGVFEGWGR